jgi:hypothetical protein
MLKCAIPGCEAEEKFLRSGTLQIVDTAKEERMTKRMIPSQHTPWYWQPAPANNRTPRVAAESRHPRENASNAIEVARRIWNSRPTGDRLHMEKSQPAAHAHHKGH